MKLKIWVRPYTALVSITEMRSPFLQLGLRTSQIRNVKPQTLNPFRVPKGSLDVGNLLFEVVDGEMPIDVRQSHEQVLPSDCLGFRV